MRITTNRKKLNQLIDWFRCGDGWIMRHYDPSCHAWRESQRPHGWSPWGRAKFEADELAWEIESLSEWLAREAWHDPNYCRAHRFLKSIGIIIE